MTVTDEMTPLVGDEKGKSDHHIRRNDHDDHNATAKKFLSLDFDRIVNSYSTAATRARNEPKKILGIQEDGEDHPHAKSKDQVISDTGFVVSRWVLTVLVGLCTGITAVVILHFVELLVTFRVTRLNSKIQAAYTGVLTTSSTDDAWVQAWSNGLDRVYIDYTLYNLSLVLVSTLLCLTLAPTAVGSGIPEVMAYLNGIRVGVFDNFQLLFVKLLGTIFSVSSGLVIGPEGPVVHLGAIWGASMTKTGDLEWMIRKFRRSYKTIANIFGCADSKRIDIGNNADGHRPHRCQNSFLSDTIFYLSHFRNDVERRNLISVGAAAGFAAAFGAPVGGLLYSMEEASSFFAHDMLWKTLVGTVVATVCIAMYHGDFTKYSMLSLEIGVQEEDLVARFTEVPLYLVLGALGGLFGGCFNHIYHFMNHKRKHFYDGISKKRVWYFLFKLSETALVSVVTSVIMLTAPLRASWACTPVEENMSEEQAFSVQYNCPPGFTNEIGGILFGSREESIKDILTDPSAFHPATLLAVGIIFLSLMTITFGIAVPSGMFMPAVLTGACFGGYLGMEFKEHLIDSVHPTDFALIGAAAFLSGMQRNVVSLCVILMEGTGQTKCIIPIILTIVCARGVGDLFSEGVYEIGMELKGYPYLHHGEKTRYDAFTAKDVMDEDVDCFNLVETAEVIETILLESGAHAFPVVNREDGHYRGLIRRDQLIAALECKIYLESFLDDQDIEHNNVAPSQRELRSQVTFKDDPRSSVTLKATAKAGAALLATYRNYHGTLDVRGEFEKAKTTSPVADWNPDAPETSSPWLRDNVLVDGSNEIMFGMDETLPDGIVQTEENAIVKTENGKVVVYVPPSEKKQHVDIGCLMNKAATSVSVEYPLSKTYNLFGSLGLRHLPVLKTDGLVAGMITREELRDEHIAAVTGYELY